MDDLYDLEKTLKRWEGISRERVTRAFRRIGVAWKGESQKRIPVDKSTAKQNVVTNTYWEDDGNIVTETGTNLRDDESGAAYPIFLEFGTRYIARGKVKALGNDPYITDAQAVHTWPAKEGEAIETTSASYRKIDGGSARFNKRGSFVGSGPQEQMPWLRPAFNFLRDWAIAEIDLAFEPPPK